MELKEGTSVFTQSGEEVGIMIGNTTLPGFYRVFDGAERVGSIAVNVDARESNLERLNLEQVQEFSRISRNRFYASEGKDFPAILTMEIRKFGVMKSEFRKSKSERIPKSEVLPPIRPALPVADAFAGFVGVPVAA